LIVGVLAAFAGAWAAIWLQRHSEKKKELERRRFTIYMLLLELKSLLFWSVSWELNKKKPDPNVLNRRFDLCMRIADEVRKADSLPEVKEILRVLFSVSYQTEQKRNAQLQEILDKMGHAVNPRYQSIIREIDEENSLLMVQNPDHYMDRLHQMRGF